MKQARHFQGYTNGNSLIIVHIYVNKARPSVRMSFEAWASVRMSLEVRMLVCPLKLEREPK